MSSVDQLTDRVLNVWLEGTFRAQYNQLLLGIGASDTTLQTVAQLAELAKGSFLSIDNELLLVTDRDTDTNTLTVLRGMRGTAPASHLAGALIEANPRFPRWLVRDTLRRELLSWPESLCGVFGFDVGLIAMQSQVNLAAFVPLGLIFTRVLGIKRESLDTTDDRWRPVDGWDFNRGRQKLQLRQPVDQVTTLHIDMGILFNTALWTASADLESVIGLQESQEEILEVGAAARLLTGRQSVRLFPEAQAQSREGTEVTEVGMARLGQSYQALRDLYLAREVQRLQTQYGFSGLGYT